MRTNLDLEELRSRQRRSLWLEDHPGIHTLAEAERFLDSVGFALRYNATEGLPLASMYEAGAGRAPEAPTRKIKDRPSEETGEIVQRLAVELTNELLAKGAAVEVNIIAGRLVLAHKRLVPALYNLRRRGAAVDDLQGLSINAARAYALISQKKRATFGDIRRHFGITGWPDPDPAGEALAELQRHLLVDRGPSEVPKQGIPYLSKEGIPYRVFHEAHNDIVRAAAKLTIGDAAQTILLAYLKAAIFITPRKLASMFKLCLTRDEITTTIERLEVEHRLVRGKAGKAEVVVVCE
ncbi:MAG TPA: hypothetical protein VJH03_02790 [Blastocatellia bacterium]|nr:hypothetical protein [Blastocatellia bacterium]